MRENWERNAGVTQSVFRAGPVKLYEYQQIKIIFLTFRSYVSMHINILVYLSMILFTFLLWIYET